MTRQVWHVHCMNCKIRYDDTSRKRPTLCGGCGSWLITVTDKIKRTDKIIKRVVK